MRDLHRWIVCGVAGWLSLASGSVVARQDMAQHAGHTGKLGTVHFPTSCAADGSAVVRALAGAAALVRVREATEGFQAVLGADSTCAIAHWGIALAAWGNPFAAGIKPPPRFNEDSRPSSAAGRLAARSRASAAISMPPRSCSTRTTRVDQAHAAVAYRDAMQSLAAREYPADIEATIFYALSLAITAPPTDKTYASQLKAGAMLEELFAAASRSSRPGALHHPRLRRAGARADARSMPRAATPKIAPSAPHALHMPSHTFTRVGEWQRIDRRQPRVGGCRAKRRLDGRGASRERLPGVRLSADGARRRSAARCSIRCPRSPARFDPSAHWFGGAAVGRLLRRGCDPGALRAGARRLGRRRGTRDTRQLRSRSPTR